MKKAATLMLSVFLLCAGLLLVPPKAEATGPPGKVITIEKKMQPVCSVYRGSTGSGNT